MRSIQAILVHFASFSALLHAQEPAHVEKMLVGTWKLVSTEEKLRDGRTRPYPDMGPNGSGYLMYSADGHMCAALMKPKRPNWHADEEDATDAEKISAASGFTGYCGTYRVDEKNNIVFHYPEVSFYPNFIGSEQKRPYRLEGNRLILSDSVSEGDVERWTIVWEKIARIATSGDTEHSSAEIVRPEQSAVKADKR